MNILKFFIKPLKKYRISYYAHFSGVDGNPDIDINDSVTFTTTSEKKARKLLAEEMKNATDFKIYTVTELLNTEAA